MVHVSQLSALACALNEPLAHAVHARSAVALPAAVMIWPGEHDVQGTHAVAELPSWSQLPLAHATFGATSPAQYVPASQGSQTGGDVGVAACVCTVPAAHVPAAPQLASFGEDEYVPSAHGAQTRSAIGLPTWLT